MNNNLRRRAAPRRKTVKLHGYVIEDGKKRAMTINGPGGNDVIALFTNKAHADKVLLSYAAGHEVKHYGLIALKD